MNHSEIIKKIISDNNLTQAKLAENLGIKPRAINHIASGSQKISIELAQSIAQKYEYSFEWILTGKGSMILTPEQETDHTEIINLIKEKQLSKEEVLNLIENYSKSLPSKQAFNLLISTSQGDKISMNKLRQYLDTLESLFDEL